MKPYGVPRSWDEFPLFKNSTRKSTKKHSKIKKMFHRLARRTWNNKRRKWKSTKDI